jgi:hypothetical protein
MEDGLLQQRFGLRGSEVVSELVDDEVVIVDLESGFYYSLQGSGAVVWSLLMAAVSPRDVILRLEELYQAEGGVIEHSIITLLEQLIGENLIVPAGPDHEVTETPLPPLTAGRPFVVPELGKFTDMEELLLVDPVHDTTEAGWPRAADGAAGSVTETVTAAMSEG